MKFRTEIHIQRMQKVNASSHILMIGSCFAEHMMSKLAPYKIPTINNPFGITYNPISIAEQILSLSASAPPKVFLLDQQPYPFSHHGSFRKSTEEATLHSIRESWVPAQQSFHKINHCILTLGSAYAWVRNGTVVNNCHKRPKKEFTRTLLCVDAIVRAMESALGELPADCTITCTISPIRHIRDGMLENNLSKSTLRLALHELQKNDKRIQYFPSYEIIMDDLRDYRFYESDLIHPNGMAVSYIWEHVQKHLIDVSLHKRYTQIQDLHKRLHHRVQDSTTSEFYRFVQSTQQLFKALQSKYPHIDWSEEEMQLTQLRALLDP